MTQMQPQRTAVIVEDDVDIAGLIDVTLRQAGFVTYTALDGPAGLELIEQHDPVLTTLDVNLPTIDGFEVARRIRAFSNTYIMMLSSRQDEIDTLIGLDAGADDYLAKPFRPRELRARVEAMLRRLQLNASTGVQASGAADSGDAWLSHNGLRLHPTMRLVEMHGEPVELTRTEFDILEAVILRQRRVITKDELAAEVRPDLHGYVTAADRRTVESHLANLRRKLGDSPTDARYIETVRGVGYRLAKVAP